MGVNLLGSTDASKALSDLRNLRAMFERLPTPALKTEFAQSAILCERMIQDAVIQDADVSSGIECVAKLQEAFDAVKGPSAPQAPAPPPPAISNETLYWTVGIGTLGIMFMSAFIPE